MPVKMSITDDLLEMLSAEAKVESANTQGYKDAIRRWAVTAERKASLVVFPASSEDVSKTLRFANDLGVEIAVTGGGHSCSGNASTKGGISINLSQMREVSVDPESKMITVQGGAIWEDVDKETIKHGLVTVGGTVNQTGVGGLTLGGGYGYLSGTYGLAIDNLLSVEIVLANGQIATASKRENPGLFWAVRGAGSGFGVVTSFCFQGHEQKTPVWGGMLGFHPESLKPIVEFANGVMEKSKGEAAIMVGFTSPPPANQPCVLAVVFYNGSEESARACFGPLLEMNPVLNTTGVIPYPEINALHNAFIPTGARRTMKGSTFTFPLNPSFVSDTYDEYAKLITKTPDASKTLCLFEFMNYEKITSVPQTATAFANRGPYGNVVFASAWTKEENDESLREWTRDMGKRARDELLRNGGSHEGVGEYNNYNGLGDTTTKAVFGVNYDKLVELKRQYDPDNVFKKSYNLVPGDGEKIIAGV